MNYPYFRDLLRKSYRPLVKMDVTPERLYKSLDIIKNHVYLSNQQRHFGNNEQQ
ncbi:hypothetical protein IQ231_07410 [Cuspidothrix issatschenkoi LEGE 03284]|jgi:hypothetical protein|uniref:hypothetical protein n=1 Tax=Cuspidothrix issatschenkoi TaxID=230752 RepID=UPI0019F3998E|nr:hypothetical protein [Cuspidothrix issatschenkoi]MBE9231517.1 hypothetical protein [Cuspidothrix issatschenkoi LEGE 03284]